MEGRESLRAGLGLGLALYAGISTAALPNFAAPEVLPSDGVPWPGFVDEFGAYDLDGEGGVDLVAIGRSVLGPRVLVARRVGVGGVVQVQSLVLVESASLGFSVLGENDPLRRADVDGDGDEEWIAISDVNSGDHRYLIHTLEAAPDGSLSLLSTGELDVGGYLSVGEFSVTDVDGDGRADLLVAPLFRNTLSYWPGDGAGGFGAARVLREVTTQSYCPPPAIPSDVIVCTQVGLRLSGPSATDLDSDGIPDLMWGSYVMPVGGGSAPSFDEINWQRGRGGGLFDAPVLLYTGAHGVEQMTRGADGSLTALVARDSAGRRHHLTFAGMQVTATTQTDVIHDVRSVIGDAPTRVWGDASVAGPGPMFAAFGTETRWASFHESLGGRWALGDLDADGALDLLQYRFNGGGLVWRKGTSQPNRAPVALDARITVDFNFNSSFPQLPVSDADGNGLRYEVVRAPTRVVDFRIDYGAVEFRMPDDGSGSLVDSFTYRVTDGQAWSEVRTVELIAIRFLDRDPDDSGQDGGGGGGGSPGPWSLWALTCLLGSRRFAPRRV